MAIVKRTTIVLEVYFVEACQRRTADATLRNPTPNSTNTTDSNPLEDLANCERWSLPSLIAARAGPANNAEGIAIISPFLSAFEAVLPATVLSLLATLGKAKLFFGNRRWREHVSCLRARVEANVSH